MSAKDARPLHQGLPPRPSAQAPAAGGDILTRIMATKKREVAAAKARVPEAQLRTQAAHAPPTRGFEAALRARHARAPDPRYALIAEIKKASPSKGLIRADFNPAQLAKAYEAGGASCLSVLTDRDYFQGEDAFLGEARAACALPVLRKDFLFDPYSVYESRVLGADCILVILAALSDAQAGALLETAQLCGLDALIEVHNETEMARALAFPFGMIGINTRDLRSFAVDLAVAERLAPMVPHNRLLVGESGIFTPADCARLARAGLATFLVGESLMRQSDVAQATRVLLGAA